ncbi:hypothetical protein [Demequina sp. NBRC 110053]|uniref:hypothetical protein n=1 Tax=Demequina sp. NBRC 110053 TaxID=1570342 RepID=UPI0009FD5FD1|nr:hypothetical protein [Demequina sp. NBRC 110053]
MRLAATAAATTLSVALLAGCSAEGLEGAASEFAGDAAQQALDEVTGGGVSVDLGDGATLPEDWPAGLPAPAGELAAAAATGAGWTVAATGPSLEMTDYVAALEEAGFAIDQDVAVAGSVTAQRLSDGAHVVDVAWAAQPGSDAGLLTVIVMPEGGAAPSS